MKQTLDKYYTEIKCFFIINYLSWFNSLICLLCVCCHICFLPQGTERTLPDFCFIMTPQKELQYITSFMKLCCSFPEQKNIVANCLRQSMNHLPSVIRCVWKKYNFIFFIYYEIAIMNNYFFFPFIMESQIFLCNSIRFQQFMKTVGFMAMVQIALILEC